MDLGWKERNVKKYINTCSINLFSSNSKWVQNSAHGRSSSNSEFSLSSLSSSSSSYLSLSAVGLVKPKPKTRADLRHPAQPWTYSSRFNSAPRPAQRLSNAKMIYKRTKCCFFCRKHSGQYVLSILPFLKKKKLRFFVLLSELLETFRNYWPAWHKEREASCELQGLHYANDEHNIPNILLLRVSHSWNVHIINYNNPQYVFELKKVKGKKYLKFVYFAWGSLE